MATSNNLLLQGVSGHIGKQIVIKQYEGKTVIANYPKQKKRKPTPGQKVNRDKMFAANYYAKGVIANEKKRAEAQLRLDVTRNKLYTALVREFFQKGAL